MRIAISGDCGYIGQVLAGALQARDHQLEGIDLGLYRSCDFGPLRVVPIRLGHEIREPIAERLVGVDAVVHLAALSNDPLGALNPELTYEVNYRAAIRLAKAAKEAGVPRFIFSSSCSNYGAAGEDLIDESAPLRPVTAYGESKVMAEEDLLQLADDHFSPVILRSATAYGVSPRLRLDVVLNNLVASAYTTGQVVLQSDGSPWRPIVHVEDISQAFLLALEARRELVHAQVFNVGRTDENYQVRQIAQIVAETIPGCTVRVSPDAGPDVRSYRVNCDRICRILGFRPRWTARQGVQQLYCAFRQHNLTLEDFQGPRYKRVAWIKKLLGDGQLDSELRWKAGVADSPDRVKTRPSRKTTAP